MTITCSTLVTMLARLCYLTLLVFGRETLRPAAADARSETATAQHQVHHGEHLHVHRVKISPRQQRMRHRHSEVVAEQVSSGSEQSSEKEQLDDLQLYRAVWMLGGDPNPAMNGAAHPPPDAAAAAVAAGAQAPNPALSSGLVDLKGLVRPPAYDGTDAKWREFKFRFETMVMLTGQKQMLELAEANTAIDFELQTLAPIHLPPAQLLYGLLVQCCAGKALGVVKTVRDANGVLAWRRLLDEYEPAVSSRRLALMTAILQPAWKSTWTTSQFVEVLLRWERQIADYDIIGHGVITNDMKIGVILRHAPLVVRTWLLNLSPEHLDSYVVIRGKLCAWSQRLIIYDESGVSTEAVTMEIDWTKRTKWQSSGQKYKGKYSKQDDKKCYLCGKMGHIALTCPTYTRVRKTPTTTTRTSPTTFSMKPNRLRRSVAVVKENENNLQPECEVDMVISSWLLAVTSENEKLKGNQQNDSVMMDLVADCAAFDHVCPKSFASWLPMKRFDGPGARTADGREIKTYGTREVVIYIKTTAEEDISVKVVFHVMDVTKAIISLGALRRRGYEINLGQVPAISLQNKKVLLVVRGNFFFLKAMVLRPKAVEVEIESEDRFMESKQLAAVDEACVAKVPIGAVAATSSETIVELTADEPLSQKPKVPGVKEVLQHELTHTPFQPWCSICLRTKGKDSPHKRVASLPTMPLIELDYAFTRMDKQDRLCTLLVAVYRQTGYCFASTCLGKGSADPWVVGQLVAWLSEIGCMGPVILRTDSEPAIHLVASAIGRMRGNVQTIVQTTPVGSSSSLGGAERMIGTLHAALRAQALQFMERWHVKLTTTSAWFPWVVRHAMWIYNRFQVKRGLNNKTAYEAVHGEAYRHEPLAFAVPVVGREHDLDDVPKGQQRFREGLYLGRQAEADAHLIAVPDVGIVAVRTIKQISNTPLRTDLLEKMKFTPRDWFTRTPTQEQEPQPATAALASDSCAAAAVPGEEGAPLVPPTMAAPKVLTAAQALSTPAPQTVRTRPVTSTSTRSAMDLRKFWAACGKTPGCRACELGTQGRHHLNKCEEKRRMWQAQEGEEPLRKKTQSPFVSSAKSTKDVGAPIVPDRGAAVTKTQTAAFQFAQTPPLPRTMITTDATMRQMDLEPLQQKRTVSIGAGEAGQTVEESGEKRGGAACAPPSRMQGEKRHNEIEGVPGHMDLLVTMAPSTGPPFHDEITHEPLQTEKVMEGLREEVENFNMMEAYVEIRQDQLLPNDVPIPARVLLRKKPSKDDPERVKARIVIQHINKGTPLDTYAPTLGQMSARFIFAVAQKQKWPVGLGDITAAFLHAFLRDRVIVRPPHGIVEDGIFWLMLKAAYGLRVAPRVFSEFVAEMFAEIGCSRSATDPSLYFHPSGAIFATHVDDIIYTGSDDVVEDMQRKIEQHVKIKWLGNVESDWVTYLGRQYRQTSVGGYEMRVNPEYVRKLIDLVGVTHTSTLRLPFAMKTSGEELDEELGEQEKSKVRTAVGRLLWLGPARPDVQYPIKEVSRMVQKPTTRTWQNIRIICRYLKGTLHFVLKLESDDKDGWNLVGWSDASWASGPNCRSTSGGVITLNGAILSSWSRTQHITALSSAEAELVALALMTTELQYVLHLCEELSLRVKTTALTDASAALLCTQKRGPGKMKHINLRTLYVQDVMRQGIIEYVKVPGEENQADMLTKAMPSGRLTYLRELVGLRDNELHWIYMLEKATCKDTRTLAGFGRMLSPECSSVFLKMMLILWLVMRTTLLLCTATENGDHVSHTEVIRDCWLTSDTHGMKEGRLIVQDHS